MSEKKTAGPDPEVHRELEELRWRLRMLSRAAESAAGRIRSMEWEEFMGMVLGISHVVDAFVRTVDGPETEEKLRKLAPGDWDALDKALWVFGLQDEKCGRKLTR